MSVVRWILVPVAVLGAWMVAAGIGLVLNDIAFRFCPESQIESGLCVAPWWPIVDTVILSVSAAVAAMLVVWASAITAPSHRPLVAIVTFALGAAFAAYLVVDMQYIDVSTYFAVAASLSTGGLTAWWVWRKYREAAPARTSG